MSTFTTKRTLNFDESKISTSGYVSDAKVFGVMNYDIDPNYAWNPGDPTETGGTIDFKGESYTLSRTASSNDTPAIWKLK